MSQPYKMNTETETWQFGGKAPKLIKAAYYSALESPFLRGVEDMYDDAYE